MEALPEARRELVWVRCERLLGHPIEDADPADPEIDRVFDRVISEMWAADQLERLTGMGVLERTVSMSGRFEYRTAA